MFRRIDHRAGHYLLLVAVWAVLCLPNLGGPSLWDIDEGNNVRCSWEMLQSGNYVIPTFNGNLREDKPVLIYWLQIACAWLFGPNEWAGRFPSAAAALLTVLAVYELGRQTFGVRAALLAGVILVTSLGPIGAAHFANPDALLLAFTTWSLALFWHDYRTGGRGWLVGVGVASGLAVLAKGPIGLVMPAGVALFFLAWQRQLSRLWDSRIPGMVLAFVLVAAPWYVWVGVETHGAWLVGFWNRHHVNRMTTALENHSGPSWYYVVVLLAGLAPWSIFLGPTLRHAWRLIKDEEVKGLARLVAAPTLRSAWRWLWTSDGPGEAEPAAIRFFLVWFGVYFIFFSVIRTKLPNYILPVYPAMALLTAHLLERWRRGEAALPAWLVRISLGCLALIGVGAAVALVLAGGLVEAPFLRGRSFPGLAAWAWLGAIPLAAAAVGWRLLDRDRRGGLIATVAVSAVLFAAPAAGWALAAVDAQKAARSLAKALPADQTRRDVRLGMHCYTQPSLVFYCRREVVRWEREEEALAFLQGLLPSYLFVPEGVWATLAPRLPVKPRVIARHYDMYSGQMILLVTNESAETPGVVSSK